MKKGKPNEVPEALRADRWYYKNMDKLRDNPEQSGLLDSIILTFCYFIHLMYLVYISYLFSQHFA